jgi:hypothetical protein
MSSKRENFVRLAEARVSRAMQSISVIGNLANRGNYEYSEDDLRKINKALTSEIETMSMRFRNAESKPRPEFKL